LTTPTISIGRAADASAWVTNRRPSGLVPAKNALTNASLTIATGSVGAESSGVNIRPCWSRMPIVSKKRRSTN
jgi:hypothetical protein